MTRTLSLLLLVLASGCSTRPRDYSDVDLGEEPASSKEVLSRRAPNRLIATDGSTCTVSRDEYTDTRVGDLVACYWSR